MMKKEKNGVKATLLSLVMAVMLTLPMSLLAQKSDGFFRSNNNDDVYNDRDASTLINGGGFTNNPMNQQDPDSEAPLGSGLLIMVAAGAGYAVARRKKAVRNGAALLMAGIIILGLTQCKKKDVATVVDNTANLVPMTLTTDGAKTSFDDGVISWVSGDYLNVVAGGKCIGTLAYDGTDFTGYVDLGDFDNLDETTFYFYYVGNKTIGSGETSFTMSMSGQDGAKASLGNFHISTGSTMVEIDKSGMNVSATMRSYTSVAYFNVSGFNSYSETGENLYMYGDNIYEQLTISFLTNEITAEHAGYYISAGTSADKADAYYMFIPTSADGQTEVNHVVNFVNKRTSATTTFKYGIVSNGWYCDGAMNNPIAVTGASYDAGALRGVFSINNSKGTVHFSQGNLQYQASTSTWRFAENQYDYVGDASNGNVYVGEVKSNNANIADDYTGWIDLFGCGTGNYPTKHTTSSSDYSPYVDWGTSASGNIGSNWRAMSSGNNSEWEYIYKTRSTTTNNLPTGTGSNTAARFIMVKINNTYKGLVLFPDTYTHPQDVIIGGTIIYNDKSDYTATISTIDDLRKIEAAGAVFLPAAGQRSNTSVSSTLLSGYYWGGDAANSFYFSKSYATCGYTAKYSGCSVRLVK